MRKPPLAILSMILLLLSFGCSRQDRRLEAALESIDVQELASDIKILSSDEFEGRFPASEGEIKTINFLKSEFETIGLKPGNGDSFFQEVPMVKITADPDTELSVRNEKTSMTFRYGEEFVGVTMREVEEISLNDSEMIFVGYGIIAPEYDWNDYSGVDIRGKTAVMLVNDPGFATKDPDLFNGRAMTYYGRWTYKYEEAARQGASGAIIIHDTEPAAYGWGVVYNGWTGPQFYLTSDDKNMSRCAFEGWVTLDTANQIFDGAGLDFDQIARSAVSRDFRSVPLGLNASMTLRNEIERSVSHNVIALLPGSERADEYIIYMAHWDHFGIDPTLEGDQIFNGALDNATGTAALLELAEAFKKLRLPPARSILFLALTGEEQGLLGSKYYATNPGYPPTKTVAAINMDSLDIYGKMKDITVIGYGQSELDDYIAAEAAEQGRRVRPDPKPERGSFYRSDHFPFAKEGIPAMYITTGIDQFDHGEEWTQALRDRYLVEKYHKPTDEFDPSWDLSGAIEDLRLLFKIGHRLSMETSFPNWKEGSEFKAKRDKDMERTQ